MLISGNEPDVILLTESIPKAQSLPIGYSQIAIPNYMLFTNFDPNSSDLGSSGIRGIIFCF